jgi:hypothetical protein
MAKKDKEEQVEEEEEVQEEPVPERFIVYKKGGAKFWQYEDGRLEIYDE